MSEQGEEYPLQLSAADYTLRLVKAAASLTPIAGGAIDEVISWITPSLARKQAEWCNQLANRVHRLERDGLRIEDLEGNPAFASTVVHTIRAALSTDQELKLTALRNAVLNVAVGNAPGADRRQFFLMYVDQLTAAHLKVLKFLSGATDWIKAHNLVIPLDNPAMLDAVLDFIVPELENDHDLYNRILVDLSTNGFLKISPGGAFRIGIVPREQTRTGPGDALDPYQHMTSALGDDFLRFISSPLADDTDIFHTEDTEDKAVQSAV